MSKRAWPSLTLAELVDDAIGGLWGSSPESTKLDETDVLVVRGADFRNWDDQRALNAASRRIPTRALERRRLAPGDLILEVSGGSPAQPVGRTLVIDERAVAQERLPLICSNFCRKLRLKPGVDPYLVKRQLDLLYRSGHADHFQTSTTNIRNLQVNEFLRGTPIVLPDHAEQRLLADLLDRADSSRNSSSAHLVTARKSIERFRRAVLTAACSGRLTAEWRDARPNYPAMSSVLCEKASGQLSVRQRKAIGEFDVADLPELPLTWAWAPLAAVSNSVLGKMLDKAKNRGEHLPYLRNINVRWRGFDFNDIFEMRFEAGEEDRYGLQSGDVLVCEGGEPGRAAVWRGEELDMRFQKALHRVRCEGGLLLPEWLMNVLQAHAVSGVLSKYFTGSGIAHLTGVSLARLPIPLPPPGEQAVLVRLIDRAWSSADSVVARIEFGSRAVDRASQAVLSKAFRGELQTLRHGVST